jgi:hypothetical protein
VPINPDFSALEAVITAKVESVATNIDNKDLLIQMKALEASIANLALTRVIAEGTYQQGQVTNTAATAITNLNQGVTTAQTNLSNIISTATTNLNSAAAAALTTFTTDANAIIDQINDLLDQLGSVNAQQIIDLVTDGLADISAAATTATGAISTAYNTAAGAITQLQSDAVTVIAQAGTTALDDIGTTKSTALSDISGAESVALLDINTAKDQAIAAVSASSNVADQIAFLRNDRWLGLNIFAPTNTLGN